MHTKGYPEDLETEERSFPAMRSLLATPRVKKREGVPELGTKPLPQGPCHLLKILLRAEHGEQKRHIKLSIV